MRSLTVDVLGLGEVAERETGLRWKVVAMAGICTVSREGKLGIRRGPESVYIYVRDMQGAVCFFPRW